MSVDPADSDLDEADEVEPPQRRPDGTFLPGRSPNAGGRAKVSTIAEAAGQYGRLAIKTLKEIMTDPKASASARIQAANSLLDRSVGRPAPGPQLIPTVPSELADRPEQERLRKLDEVMKQFGPGGLNREELNAKFNLGLKPN